MNQCSVLIIICCVILWFSINSVCSKIKGIRCGQNTLLCSCNELLARRHIAINVEYCLTKLNTCEPCDQITNTEKCGMYEKYCDQSPNNGNSYNFLPDSKLSTSAPCHCLNGGTCVYDSEGTCICLEEFEGALCELPRQMEPDFPTMFCEIPDKPKAGYIWYDSQPIIPGESIQFKCSKGYELRGNITRYCQESGTFDGVAPTCEKICRIPNMNYNRLNYLINPNHNIETQIINQYGNMMITEIHFSCRDNFHLVGPSTIHCSNGIWDKKPPSCLWYRLSCPVPVIDSQLMTQEPDKNFRAVIPESVFQYKCKHGAVMIGDNMIVCSYNGSWVPQPPTCLKGTPTLFDLPSKSCPAPKRPDNGYVRLNIDLAATPGIKTDYSVLPAQTQVLYNCYDGYQLNTTESTQTCLPDGRWNGKQPWCIPECGKPNMPPSPQILNGIPITINRWPWQAGLYIYETGILFCGGSVLNERWVLTAAHCITFNVDGVLQLRNYETYGLFFGQSTSKLDVLHQISNIKQVGAAIYHQDFNPNSLDSDIALIYLQTPLTFSNEIHPVCLPTFKSSTTDIANSIAFVAGWGQTNPTIGNVSLQLRYIQEIIVTNDVCLKANVDKNGFPSTITQNMFCAAGIKEGSGTCHGDSGGSLCVKTGPPENEVFQIEGIISFGSYDGCGVKGQYDVFTKVRNFIDWIRSNIN